MNLSSPFPGAIALLASFAAGSLCSGQEILARPTPIGSSRRVEIVDPAFGIPALALAVPSDWKFVGAIQRDPCGSGPLATFRATSPDGRAGIESHPTLYWYSASAPALLQAYRAHQCMIMQPVAPAEFMQRVVIPKFRPGAQFVAMVPLSADETDKFNQALRDNNERSAAAAPPGMKPIRFNGEMVRARIRYNLNGHPEEEVVSVVMSTTTMTMPDRSEMKNSFATVASNWAPAGQLDSMKPTLEAISSSVKFDPRWQQQQAAAAQRQANATNASLSKQLNDSGAARQRNHQAYMQAQQDRADRNRQNNANQQKARHEANEATADYAGDRQKVRDPNTGGTTKVSSRYTYTWVNESGQKYQTNDVNDNPNGRLAGSWTLMQRTR